MHIPNELVIQIIQARVRKDVKEFCDNVCLHSYYTEAVMSTEHLSQNTAAQYQSMHQDMVQFIDQCFNLASVNSLTQAVVIQELQDTCNSAATRIGKIGEFSPGILRTATRVLSTDPQLVPIGHNNGPPRARHVLRLNLQRRLLECVSMLASDLQTMNKQVWLTHLLEIYSNTSHKFRLELLTDYADRTGPIPQMFIPLSNQYS